MAHNTATRMASKGLRVVSEGTYGVWERLGFATMPTRKSIGVLDFVVTTISNYTLCRPAHIHPIV
jgi:hypothetical protein